MPKDMIKFGAVGDLPAPDGHPAPQIFLLHHRKGAVKVEPGKEGDYPPNYSFTPMKPDYWTDWEADGFEDCEFGRALFCATAPNGQSYAWFVCFQHDGDPSLEFWGARFEAPTPVETMEQYQARQKS
jgi:hypothetical protein